MAFNIQSWCRISSSSNNAITTLQNGSFIGAPNVFSYISASDAQAVIAAANYFSAVVVDLNVGDLIYAVDSANVPTDYLVTAKNNDAKTVTVVNAAAAGGDVIGPAVSTDNALVRFDGVTGKLVQNGVILESDAGDLTLVNSIANASGAVGAPSYSFTGDLDTGMWRNAANTINFSVAGAFTAQMTANTFLVNSDGITSARIRVQSDSANIISLAAPAGLGASAVYTLPSVVPTINGQVMKATTAGVMFWGNPQASIWIDEIATPTLLVANLSFIADTGGLLTFNMPALVTQGSTFEIAGFGAGGWLIQLAAGQTIFSSGGNTNVAGSLSSTNQYDSVRLLCTVANVSFTVISGSGALQPA